MANVGVERVNYFCPRRKFFCVLALYFTSKGGSKQYTLIECVKMRWVVLDYHLLIKVCLNGNIVLLIGNIMYIKSVTI